MEEEIINVKRTMKIAILTICALIMFFQTRASNTTKRLKEIVGAV